MKNMVNTGQCDTVANDPLTTALEGQSYCHSPFNVHQHSLDTCDG